MLQLRQTLHLFNILTSIHSYILSRYSPSLFVAGLRFNTWQFHWRQIGSWSDNPFSFRPSFHKRAILLNTTKCPLLNRKRVLLHSILLSKRWSWLRSWQCYCVSFPLFSIKQCLWFQWSAIQYREDHFLLAMTSRLAICPNRPIATLGPLTPFATFLIHGDKSSREHSVLSCW